MENNDLVQPAAVALTPESATPETGAQKTEQDVALQEEQAVEQGFRPKKKQTAVAVLFVAILCLKIIWSICASSFDNDVIRCIISVLIIAVLPLVGWTMLTFFASNKATRFATFCILGRSLCLFFLLVVGLYSVHENKEELKYLATVFYLIYGLSSISDVYAISLIQKNNKLTVSDRNWINIIALFIPLFSVNMFLFGYAQSAESDWVFSSFYYSVFFVLGALIRTIAMWRLARCEAFSGKYDAEAEPNTYPLNKWVVMAVVVPAVLVIAIRVIYSSSWFN